MPSAKEQGFEAAKDGLGFLDNPYLDKRLDPLPEKEVDSRLWVDGFVDGLKEMRNA